MQIMLPSKHFEHEANLAKLHAEPDAELSMITKEIKETNKINNLCIQICAHLEALSKPKKFTVYLNSCRINDDLLMKKDYLLVLKSKDSHFWLEIIKKMHNQPIMRHSGTKQTLNIICQHYYWLEMREYMK